MKRRTAVAAGLLVVGLAVAGGAAAQSSGEPPSTSPSSEPLDADQVAALEAIQTDAPIPVVDSEGVVRGSVRNSQLTARDDRVLAQIVAGFRERQGQVDAPYDELFEALRILDPVPVVDDDGDAVGYWTSNFKEPEQIEVLRPTAQQMADAMLSAGGGG